MVPPVAVRACSNRVAIVEVDDLGAAVRRDGFLLTGVTIAGATAEALEVGNVSLWLNAVQNHVS